MPVLRLNSRGLCGLIIIALLSAGLGVALIPRVQAAEPNFENILDTLGFTQRTLVSTQTFVAGHYKITMWAEFAGYRDQNQLRWYPVGTSTFNLIFDGPDGVPPGQDMGYVPSPETTATKTFTSNTQFGLSLKSPDSQSPFFTETSRNPDALQHAKVYQSTTNPNLYFIGFENMAAGSGSDFDYNDMVVSLRVSEYDPVLWVDGNATLYGPCLKTTTFPIDVRLWNDILYTNSDVYAFDFNLTWSAAPITLTSIVVHPPWAAGQYFLIDNSTFDSNYHLAMTAIPPGQGLTNAINVSLVTLTFHIDQDMVWPNTVPIVFNLVNNGMSGDGTTVTLLTPELDNGVVVLQSVEPDIHLQSSDMIFDNSTKLYMVTERTAGVTHTIEVHISNATDVFGFYVDLRWSSTYKNSSIQKITINPSFPPPYEYIDMIVTAGEAKVTLVRPCEKAPVCGADVTAFTIVLTVLPADAGMIPTPFNTTISIASAFVLSKDYNGIVWEYDYNHQGPFTADPHVVVSNYGYGLDYSCNLINFWNPKRPDITLDGKIDIADLSALAKKYGQTHPWGALSTVGSTTTVDIFDFVYIAKNFGDC